LYSSTIEEKYNDFDNIRIIVEVSEEEVSEIAQKLKNSKSPGDDGITNEMLKQRGNC
jgi:hypothetical protein